MRRLFIIRHGNTFASSAEARRVGSRTDIPLVESGRAQAEQLGQWFAREKLPVRRILPSPLQRARQTAVSIAAAVGVPCGDTCDWLGEIDHGPDEDQPEAAVLARIGAEALTRWDEDAIPPDGWIVNVEARVKAWQTFFAEGGEGADLLVTSNGAARFALVAAGLPLRALKLRTGAFGELAVDEEGRVSLIRWDVRP